MTIETYIQKARDQYGDNICFEIDGSNRLVIRNMESFNLEKFEGDRQFIHVGKSEIVRVNELIK